MRLTEDELMALQSTKLGSIVMQLKAEAAAVESGRAAAEARAAQLEYENTVLKIYLNYGLDDKHRINETTGEIQLKKEDNGSQEDHNEDNQIAEVTSD
jgi:hypothetical protein